MKVILFLKNLIKKFVVLILISNIFQSNGSKKNIIGKDAPVKILSEGIEIFELNLKKNFSVKTNLNQILSVYVIKGSLKIFDKNLKKHDFVKIQKMNEVEIIIKENSKIFCILSSSKPSYKTYV